MIIKKLITLCAFLFIPLVTHGVEVVRLDIQIGTTSHIVDLELFDTITPATVINFINYVDENPRYDGSFLHRSLPGFIVQGGGYTYAPALGAFEYDATNGVYTGGLQEITVDAPIVNEFQGSGLSNIRGTIAMAKIASLPNSATSGWFINLADNSANLDVQNDGFTVFGRVLDNGMTVFDLIEATPIFDITAIHPAFDGIPLDSYNAGDAVTQSNLIRVNSASLIQRPILKVVTGTLDFGLLAIGDSASLIATLKNTGKVDLVMDGSSISIVPGPYLIIADTCSNTTLYADSENDCSITLQYAPVTLGVNNSQLEIVPSVNPNNVTLSVDITGEGVPATPVIQITGESSTLDFAGITTLSTSDVQDLVIQNRGGGTLSIMSVTVSGADSDVFNEANTCNGAGSNLVIAQTCTITVDFSPVIGGIRNATLTITLNDGTNTVVKEITLIGEGLEPDIEVPLSYDAGTTQLNVPVTSGLLLKNIGAGELVINSIVISGVDATDFSQESTCPDVATIPGHTLEGVTGQCYIIITFTPGTAGTKSAALALTSTDPDEPTININLIGEVGVSDVEVITDLDVGVSSIIGIPAFSEFEVFNRGSASLSLTAYDLTGPDSADYSILTDCSEISTGSVQPPLEFNDSCTIVVRLQAGVIGTKTALLTLDSNDPDEPTVTINLSGVGDTDIDGIVASIEQSEPNSGDGNNDLVQDDVQSSVVSFITKAGSYATIASPMATAFVDLALPGNPDVNGSPQGILFDHGVFKFDILVSPDTPVEMAIYMPQGDASSILYKFGPTPDNTIPHWYDFSYDETTGTGARYIGNVSIEATGGGSPISRSMFIVSFIDGARGDDDLLVNDVITNTMALGSVDNSNEGSSGAISWLSLMLTYLLLSGFRRFKMFKC